MNPLASFDAMGVVFGLFVAALSARLARAPGWGHLRGLTATGLAATVFFSTGLAFFAFPGHAPVIARVVLAASVPLVWAWAAYASRYLGQPAPRWWRWLFLASSAVALLGLVPGVTFTDRVATPEALVGVRLYVVEGTPVGSAVMLALLAMMGGLLWRFVLAWRRGLAGAFEHALGAALALLAAFWDASAAIFTLRIPFLADLGLLLALALITLGIAGRFRREAEERRLLGEELEGEVARRTAELEERSLAAARAAGLASLGRLAAGVAHEVNSPLAAAHATLEWLGEADRGAAAEALEALEDTRRSLERIRAIVRQLGFAAGAAPGVARVPVAIDRALDDAVRAARTRRPGASFAAEITPGLAVLADEGALVQVVVNLLLNSADAVEPDGEARDYGSAAPTPAPVAAPRRGAPARTRPDGVRLRAVALEGCVRIEVEDDGPGMPPEVKARLFEPFFSTKPFGRGTGLGLAVSRGLVAALGGQLEVDSAPGRGTTARFELPAARLARPGAAQPGPAATARRLRLLLVDDDRAVRNALRRLLAVHHDVELADGVESAWAVLRTGAWDAVLCDVAMPEGGGERLYRLALAEQPVLARRFIFVTGGARDEDGRRFLAGQRQPVLEKPLDPAALEAALAELAGSEWRAG